MKVIHLISGGDTGGAKTHVLSLLRELNRTITAQLVCFREGEFAQEAREMGIPTEIFAGRNILKVRSRLLAYIRQISSPHLRQLLEYFFVKDETFIRRFKGHSAAKTVHHSFSGGLLEHTLSVVHLCEYFAGAYSILNRDLLITATLCHDIGKTRELSAFPDNDYTDEGQLIGHIVIGVEMIDEALREQPDFPVKLANELKHCVVAHHGELEYGSPKKPALAEALALNLADNADAKLQTLTEIFKGKTGTEWLGFNRLFESNLRRTSGT